jgi:CRISPR/Cas system CSM-associated protein Csm3 (group 7 of RAMP superfamily)
MPNRLRRRGGERPEPEPKPFGNPKGVDEVRIRSAAQKDQPKGHESFSDGYSGQLIFEMTTITPVHVGSGLYELLDNRPVRGLAKTPEGAPIIPGTSIKGAVRSTVEAISASCVHVANDYVNDSLVDGVTRCQSIDRDKARKELCVACRIFGGLGYHGRISFSDAHKISGPEPTTHRVLHPQKPDKNKSVKHYRDRDGRFYRRKFYFNGRAVEADSKTEPYQVFAPSTVLKFTMDFENLSGEELCLLLTAMGIFSPFNFKLGGAKFVMLGTVSIKPVALQLHEHKKEFVDWDYRPTLLSENILEWLRQNIAPKQELILADGLSGLLEIWSPTTEHVAPKGAY